MFSYVPISLSLINFDLQKKRIKWAPPVSLQLTHLQLCLDHGMQIEIYLYLFIYCPEDSYNAYEEDLYTAKGKLCFMRSST